LVIADYQCSNRGVAASLDNSNICSYSSATFLRRNIVKTNMIVTNLTSDDPERLITFYRDVVGLAHDENSGGFGISDTALFAVDGHSDTSGPTREPSRVLVSFMVDDLAAEEERLKAAGVTFVRSQGKEPWGGMFSTFRDPDGNYVQLGQAPG
jgi:predicted enzyme related to lactoylglutathione lyase